MLEIKNVYFKYDKADILKNITLLIGHGEQILLIGENGCGKSTLLSLIGGLYSPYKGSINIDEISYKNEKKEWKKKVGMMFQEALGFNSSKVIDVLKFFSTLHNDTVELSSIITLTNIYDLKDKKIGKLSGGERQKVALAIALLGDPEYLLLDEPMSALDVPSRKEFVNILNTLKKYNKTIIITSHILEELYKTSDKVILIKNNSIKFFGEIDKLLLDCKYKYTIKISSENINISAIEKYKNIDS